jgi:hypothetical protein
LPNIIAITGHHVHVTWAGYHGHVTSFKNLASATIQFEGVASSAVALIPFELLRGGFIAPTFFMANTLPPTINGVVTDVALAKRSFQCLNTQIRTSAVFSAQFTWKTIGKIYGLIRRLLMRQLTAIANFIS